MLWGGEGSQVGIHHGVPHWTLTEEHTRTETLTLDSSRPLGDHSDSIPRPRPLYLHNSSPHTQTILHSLFSRKFLEPLQPLDFPLRAPCPLSGRRVFVHCVVIKISVEFLDSSTEHGGRFWAIDSPIAPRPLCVKFLGKSTPQKQSPHPPSPFTS